MGPLGRGLRGGEILLRGGARTCSRVRSRPRGAHQHRHVPRGVLVVGHELMSLPQPLEGEYLGKAGIDLTGDDQGVEGLGLLIVGEVGACTRFCRIHR